MAQDRVLAAVIQVLAEQGVNGLSIRTVAQTAGISAAQVQYYYRSKRDLVRAGFDYAGAEFLASLATARPQTLTDLVLQWLPLDEARERRARVWLAYAEMAVRDPQLAAEASRQDADLRRWFTSIGLPAERAAQLYALVDGVTVQCLMLAMGDRDALIERTVIPLLRQLRSDPRLDELVREQLTVLIASS